MSKDEDRSKMDKYMDAVFVVVMTAAAIGVVFMTLSLVVLGIAGLTGNLE